jgi:iron complex transport system permease protein
LDKASTIVALMNIGLKYGFLLTLGIVVLLVLNLCVGSVSIPVADVWEILCGKSDEPEAWTYIVLQSRLPQALTAMLSGGALAVSGLMLQTAFRNPLAGPDVFGINSGAGLGVALVMLAMGGSISTVAFSVSGFVAILLAAFVGAMLVTAIIFAFSTVVHNSVMLLIIGIMIGYVSSSAISLLNFFATEEGVRSYMVWGMGNYSGVSMQMMPAFAAIVLIGLVASLILVKPLNALLLGEQYAESLGVKTRSVRNWLLVVTGLLTAITTAFCGPIAFIGLAVPHIARLLLHTENHRRLLPGTILCGSIVALLCNLICYLPGERGVIPLNAVTPLIGAPVIIYIIARRR